jgi:hypothetical protein
MTFVCFKWVKPAKGFVLPAAITGYTAHHVNVLQAMLARHYRRPHRLICVTDQPAGINCETLPLWDTHRELGGCFTRLFMFSAEARELFGPRFVCIDLDCVITQDISDLFDRPEDFVINSYNPIPGSIHPDQHYNGALYLLKAGSRCQVWNTFDPETSVQRIQNNPHACIGSDQAWIRLCLDKGEARFGNADGVYEARQVGPDLPREARIIFFAGARDPSLSKWPWVKYYWRE